MTDNNPCRITGVSLFSLEVTLGGPGPALNAVYDLIEDNQQRGVVFHGQANNSNWGPEVEATLMKLLEKVKDDLMAKHFDVGTTERSDKKLTTLFQEDTKKPKAPRSI